MMHAQHKLNCGARIILFFIMPTCITKLHGCFTDCCIKRSLDCQHYREMGHTHSGVYRVIPPKMTTGYDVYCDMTTDGGGWTVFQRRENGIEDFYRGWKDYELGFGNITGGHSGWLGFIPLQRIMTTGFHELRIELQDWKNETKYAAYQIFSIDFEDRYRLRVMGYSGTAGDSMETSDEMQFSTNNMDNDEKGDVNCASRKQGPWWHNQCGLASLNGLYYVDGDDHDDGILWKTWKVSQNGRYSFTSMKYTEMKIRRV